MKYSYSLLRLIIFFIESFSKTREISLICIIYIYRRINKKWAFNRFGGEKEFLFITARRYKLEDTTNLYNVYTQELDYDRLNWKSSSSIYEIAFRKVAQGCMSKLVKGKPPC